MEEDGNTEVLRHATAAQRYAGEADRRATEAGVEARRRLREVGARIDRLLGVDRHQA